MELNREQIIKALECCTNDEQCCDDCILLEDGNCAVHLFKNALLLINELTEENERLRAIPEQLHKEMSERMVEESKIVRKLTVRKMQEALEQRIHSKLSYYGWYLKETVIAEIAKEIIEGETKKNDE